MKMEKKEKDLPKNNITTIAIVVIVKRDEVVVNSEVAEVVQTLEVGNASHITVSIKLKEGLLLKVKMIKDLLGNSITTKRSLSLPQEETSILSENLEEELEEVNQIVRNQNITKTLPKKKTAMRKTLSAKSTLCIIKQEEVLLLRWTIFNALFMLIIMPQEVQQKSVNIDQPRKITFLHKNPLMMQKNLLQLM